MPVTLPQGTKEQLIVEVSDVLATLVTLDGTTPKFDVKNQAGTMFYTQATATNVLMKAYCLIDTSAAHPSGLWPAGTYRLYLFFTTAPELPKLGPYEFVVDTA